MFRCADRLRWGPRPEVGARQPSEVSCEGSCSRRHEQNRSSRRRTGRMYYTGIQAKSFMSLRREKEIGSNVDSKMNKMRAEN